MKGKTSSKCVVNCAGQLVTMDQAGYTQRRAIGNTDDFLDVFKKYVSPQLLSLGEPASINVVIPSFKSDPKLYRTLASLLSQVYRQDVEILIHVNEPTNASSEAKAANDRTVAFLDDLVQGRKRGTIQRKQRQDFEERLLNLTRKKRKNVKLRFARETIEGGLAEAYQIIIASYMARLRRSCDSVTGDCRAEKLKVINKRLFRTLLVFCDDDMELAGKTSIQNAYNYVAENNAIVLGKVSIAEVETRPEVKEINRLLRDIMQVFLDFKHDAGLNFLAPRGMLLADALVGGRVRIGQSFADQLYFANLAEGRYRYFINARTSVAESEHPGNGMFLRDLADYLSGRNNGATEIFSNVLNRYRERNHWGKFSVSDVENLLTLLQERKKKQLQRVAKELLSR